MNHFCVMHVSNGVVHYECIGSQCKTCAKYQSGVDIPPRFDLPAPVELYRFVYLEGEDGTVYLAK